VIEIREGGWRGSGRGLRRDRSRERAVKGKNGEIEEDDRAKRRTDIPRLKGGVNLGSRDGHGGDAVEVVFELGAHCEEYIYMYMYMYMVSQSKNKCI
jgi:hypothetical protein